MNTKLFLTLCFIIIGRLNAEVKLASLFTDNLVFQRDKEIAIWGNADAGEIVTVKFLNQNQSATADSDGRWLIKLLPVQAGGPFELTVEGINKIVLKNILVGEVWLCSGQSNMEFTFAKSDNAAEEITKANYPILRLFVVKHKVAETPQQFCEGEWVECNSNTVKQFAAAGYYFGKELLKNLNVPVGLIQSTWGGTAAECWMPKQILENDPDFKPILERWDMTILKYPAALAQYNQTKKDELIKWQIDSAAAVSEGKAPKRKPAAPDGPGSRNTPTGLYNGMIAPLIPYTIQGVIWYQGESNAGRAYQYRKLFPALINIWRSQWELGNFPFYYVQLPNLYREPEPSKSGWAELREAQLITLSLPNTGMAVTIDIGDPMNLHPTNKKDVGFRLSLIAEAKVYDMQIGYSGPKYKSMKIEGETIRISFDHNRGLNSRGSDKLLGFTICGEDKKFIPAQADISGNEVVVRSGQIKNPIAVRYAWADNPACNLYNDAMLPASPFRTDDWPGITFGKM